MDASFSYKSGGSAPLSHSLPMIESGWKAGRGGMYTPSCMPQKLRSLWYHPRIELWLVYATAVTEILLVTEWTGWFARVWR